MARIILVTGTPGVGKTVFAKLLARQTGSTYLNIGELVKRAKLYRRFDRSSKTFVIDEHRLRRSLRLYFDDNKGKGLIIDGHSLNGFMPRRRKMVALVLRLDPVILARRLKARKWPRQKVWDNVESELIDVPLYEAWKFLGPARMYEINATSKSPQKLVRQAMVLVSSNSGFKRTTVDWLHRYNPLDLQRRILR